MFTLCAVNEIKQLAFFSLFAIALLTGPATGLAVCCSLGWVQKLKGVAVGSAVGALAVVALAFMVDATGRDLTPVSGELIRHTFPCEPPDLSGKVTLGWAMLYAVKVAAIILTTKFATTSLLSFISMAMQSGRRFRRNPRQGDSPE